MSTVLHAVNRQNIYDWLTQQAKILVIEASLLTHKAKLYDGRLYLPVYIANSTDAYDDATKLHDLESTWNYQEPEPQPRIFLLPADEEDTLGWTETYLPVQKAIDRYHDAFDAFRTAGSSEEAEKALEEMKSAKEAELEASRQLQHAA